MLMHRIIPQLPFIPQGKFLSISALHRWFKHCSLRGRESSAERGDRSDSNELSDSSSNAPSEHDNRQAFEISPDEDEERAMATIQGSLLPPSMQNLDVFQIPMPTSTPLFSPWIHHLETVGKILQRCQMHPTTLRLQIPGSRYQRITLSSTIYTNYFTSSRPQRMF
jgi:hypothetical protein